MTDEELDARWRHAIELAARHTNGEGQPGEFPEAIGLLDEIAQAEPDSRRGALAHLLAGQLLVTRILPPDAADGYRAGARQMMGGSTFDMGLLTMLQPILTGQLSPELAADIAAGRRHLRAALDSGRLPAECVGPAQVLASLVRIVSWAGRDESGHGEASRSGPGREGREGRDGSGPEESDGSAPDDLDEVLGQLRSALTGDLSFLPGKQLLEGLVGSLSTMRTPTDDELPDAITRLESSIAGLEDGDVVRTMLLYDLGQYRLRLARITGSPEALRGAYAAYESAVTGLSPEHPLAGELVRGFGGLAVSGAALDLNAESVALAQAAARRIHDETGSGNAAHDEFLTSMAAFLGALGGHGYSQLNDAVEQLGAVVGKLPAGDPLGITARHLLAAVLVDRYQIHGVTEDLRNAVAYLSQDLPDAYAESEALAYQGIRGLARTLLGIRDGNKDLLETAVSDLTKVVAAYPPGAFGQARATMALGLAELGLASSTMDVDLLGSAIGRLAASDASGDASDAARSGFARTILGLVGPAEKRRETIAAGIAAMQAALADQSYVTWGRGRILAALGTAYLLQFNVSGERADLDSAIDRLLEAYLAGAEQVGYAAARSTAYMLAYAYRRRAAFDPGDHANAVLSGLAELQAAVTDVGLQIGTADALREADEVRDRALEIAGWCLGGPSPDAWQAVEALELGRGLVLRAATATADLAQRLADAGHVALTAEWIEERQRRGRVAATTSTWDREQRRRPDPARADSGVSEAALLSLLVDRTGSGDLPLRIAIALGSSRADSSFDRAALEDALRSRGYDALVYLMPGGHGEDGYALVVNGDVHPIPLPGLVDDPDGPLAHYIATFPPDTKKESREAWLPHLDALCQWAYDAVMGELLEKLGATAERPARIVLVPCGRLSVVPWNAAHKSGRWALERAVVSYAATAGQFVEAAKRARPPVGERPVLIGNPQGDLINLGPAVEALRDNVYPRAHVYGWLQGRVDGVGRPDDVLPWLPGPTAAGAATMVHFGGHAEVRSDPADSRLLLAPSEEDDGQLPVGRVLRYTAGRPSGAAGYLAVLTACTSDLTMSHFDESLTLTTSLLASGAYGVIGARWRVLEMRTAIFTGVLHHYLFAGAPAPDALRLAQMWMLGPDRAPIPGLAKPMAEELTRPDGSAGALPEVYSWAAFAHHGA